MISAEAHQPSDRVAPPVPGWFHHGTKILELIEAHRPVVCVELGTWLGASAIPVARSVRRWGGSVTCVDLWMGEVERKAGLQPASPPWMLASCARHILEAGVGASMRLVLASTAEAAAAWSGPPIDYLYVDADHSYEGAKADLEAWLPHVASGGLIAGDDYDNPLFPGVRQAWDAFEQAHGIALTRFQSDPPHPEGIQLVYGTV